MMKLLTFLCILLLATMPHAQAEDGIIADVSSRTIAVTAGFNGAQTTFFGALPEAGDVVVVVEGPQSDMVVRRKERFLGVWLNRSEVYFRHVPRFYWVASSRPLADIAPETWLASHHVGTDRLRFTIKNATDYAHVPMFLSALTDLQKRDNLFAIKPIEVGVMGGKLYRADVYIPDDAPTGSYTATTYLLRGGAVLDTQKTTLTLIKQGNMGWLSLLAEQYAHFYAFLALFLALFTGWMSAILMRRN